jgi:hypothetical protein
MIDSGRWATVAATVSQKGSPNGWVGGVGGSVEQVDALDDGWHDWIGLNWMRGG